MFISHSIPKLCELTSCSMEHEKYILCVTRPVFPDPPTVLFSDGQSNQIYSGCAFQSNCIYLTSKLRKPLY